MNWHTEVISPEVQESLENLESVSALDGFYLAGGTGLALHLGHRLSVDLDFFKPKFDEEALLQVVQRLPQFALVSKARTTLHVRILGIQISFLGYDYPILFPFAAFHGVPVADPRDIACMKIGAIAGRGTKRDFVDLYFASQIYGFPLLLALFRQKFAQVNYSMVHVAKSLVYFEDANQEPMPHMLAPAVWEEIQEFFIREIRGIGG